VFTIEMIKCNGAFCGEAQWRYCTCPGRSSAEVFVLNYVSDSDAEDRQVQVWEEQPLLQGQMKAPRHCSLITVSDIITVTVTATSTGTSIDD